MPHKPIRVHHNKIRTWDWLLILGLTIAPMTGLRIWKIGPAEVLTFIWCAVNVAFLAALWLRFDCQFSLIPKGYLGAWMHFTLIYTAFCLLVFWLGKLYQSIWRFASFTELERLLVVNVITGLFHIIGISVFFKRMPVSYYAVGIVLQTIALTAIRFAYRFVLLIRSWKEKRGQAAHRVMLIGAGEAPHCGGGLHPHYADHALLHQERRRDLSPGT